jgi:hypothetical protein
MRINPGGQIDTKDVIGRDQLVAQLWRVLERQSLHLTAERRIGKTTVLKKMIADVGPGKTCVYRDLEGICSPIEFTESVFHDVEQLLKPISRVAGKTRELLKHLKGAELTGLVKFPESASDNWKSLLTHIMSDLMDGQSNLVVLFWDEIPMMLENIKMRCGEGVAMELLDILRYFRQTHTNVRMVFTGSIGLHHVIGALKRGGYGNSPVNECTWRRLSH